MKKSTICKSKKADFLSFMQNQIQEKKMRNKIKTSANYQSSLRSFTHFLQTKGYRRSVSFESITEELIASYETYLQHERGITKNSSSFYIRTLHAAYKKGIAMLNLKLRDPFGNVYTGVDKTRKRAVNIDVIIKLMQYKKLNKSMEFSRDTFVFCFFAQGMPFIDFAKLKKENLQNGRLSYYRSKTGRLLSVKVDRIMRTIINKYASPQSDFLFPVMKTTEFRQSVYDSALRTYNLNLKKLSELLGEKATLTSYVPRHSWASEALKLHIPMHVISESMGHSNEKTTSIYLTSLDHRNIDAATRKIFETANRRSKIKKRIRQSSTKTSTLSYSAIYPQYYYSISMQEVDKSDANVDKILKPTK